MLTEPCLSFIESRLTVVELEWPCMTAQTKQGLPGRTCDSAQTHSCLVSLHSLFSFTGAARSTISWVLLSESDFKAADQHWAVHHNFTPPSHFLSLVSTHLSIPHHSSISVSLCFSFKAPSGYQSGDVTSSSPHAMLF